MRRALIVAIISVTAGCGDRDQTVEYGQSLAETPREELPAKVRPAVSDTSSTIAPITAAPVETAPTEEHTVAFLADVSCSASRRSRETCPDVAVRDNIVSADPERIIMIGDIQYPSHSQRDYRESFLPTWGLLLDRTRTVPGNHEYEMSGAAGYYEAWGEETGWWSEKIGEWLFVGINTSDGCGIVKCDSESEQYNWLSNETQREKCVVVFGHHPRFSSGTHGNTGRLDDIWRMLETNNVEAYISGHDHHYERIPGETVTQYVVGTGGADIRPVSGHREGVVENRHGFLSFKVVGERAYASFVSPDGVYDTHELTCR